MTQVIQKGGHGGLIKLTGGGYRWRLDNVVIAEFKNHDKAKAIAKKMRAKARYGFTYTIKKVK